jgi:cytochrome P450
MALKSLEVTEWFLLAILCFVIYGITLSIYRLYFHPLSKFPGPKLTAATLWFEFYHDVIRRGQFMWEIQAMHEKYGSIVRINPHELHINDPEYYDELYGSSTQKRDKYSRWVVLSASPGASFATVDHAHHRLRRGALNPFFSKRSVMQLEPLIQEKIDKLSKRFDEAAESGQTMRADIAFTALTMDIISQYSFAADGNFLGMLDFNVAWKETLLSSFEGAAMVRQFPWIVSIMSRIPPKIVMTFMPKMRLTLEWKEIVRRLIQPIMEWQEMKEDMDSASHRSIFHELRDSDLPPEEKAVERLCDEAQILTGAGSETTAHTLANILFYVLNDQKILETMKMELQSAMPSPNSPVAWTELEQLPYLVGCPPLNYAMRC